MKFKPVSAKFSFAAALLIFAGSGLHSVANAQEIDANTPWVWKGGDTTFNSAGHYGVKGVPSINNRPAARGQAASWTDNSGYFWLFGGRRSGTGVTQAVFNDLWKYSPYTQEWTWISGDSTVSGVAVSGTMGVAAPANTPAAKSLINHWKDNNGNLWIHGGVAISSSSRFNDLWKFDPTTQQWTWVKGQVTSANTPGVYGVQGTASTANMPGARANGASWSDASGNLWLFGGQGATSTSSTSYALADLWKYNIASNSWTWVQGSDLAAASNHVANFGVSGVPAATNKPGGRVWALTWTDTAGKMWMMGGIGCADNTDQGMLNDLWRYDPVTSVWTWMNGTDTINNQGVYISRGTASSDRMPRSRFASTYWQDRSGDFWLFGGISNPAQTIFTNDIWRYRVATNQWEWVKGDSISNTPSVFNTLNVPAASNEIGARGVKTSWREKDNNNVWIFGGNTRNGAAEAVRNDLWKIEACLPMSGTLSIAGDTTICAGDTVALTAPGLIGASIYNWGVPQSWDVVGGNSNYLIKLVPDNNNGTVTVQVIGGCGDSSNIVSKQIVVENIVTPTISQNVQGTTVTLSTNTGYATYQWYLNGAVIPGATAAQHIATVNGDYTVKVGSVAGCSATSTIENVSSVTSIRNTEFANRIKLSPNPATTTLNIQAEEALNLTIADLQGRVLIKGHVKGGAGMINISKLNPGVYFVVLESQKDARVRTTQKLVKE